MLSQTSLVKFRNALFSSFSHSCIVFEFQETINSDGTTSFLEVISFSDLPCKLSFSQSEISRDTSLASGVFLIATIFLPHDINIKTGSKFIVSHDDKISTFENSGVPLKFSTHQEIKLRLLDEWA